MLTIIAIFARMSLFCFISTENAMPAFTDSPATTAPSDKAPLTYNSVSTIELAQFGIKPIKLAMIG